MAEVENANKSLINKLLRHRAISLLLITLVLIAGLYFAIIKSVPYFGSKMISKETEISIGKNLKTTMLAQEEISGSGIDSAGTEKLQRFVNKLSLSHNYRINVTMVNNNTINAYAMPGGEIVVYSGIVKKMSSYEELVALLAHESTHVNERHTLSSLLRSAANSIILSVLFGDPGGISGVIAGNIQNLNGLHYSRSLETEADQKGMELMMANKVDLRGMSHLMELLKKEDHLPGSLAFLSTHPLTDERISSADAFIKTHNNSYTEREDLKAIFMSLK